MPRDIIIIVLLLFAAKSQAQDIIIDSCGIDDLSVLNQYEIQYFEKAFSSYPLENAENLSSKRVLFLTNNYGAYRKSKSEFFNQDCKPWFKGNDYPSLDLIILTAQEKLEVGDFDVIIISWSKISVTDRSREKFIENGRKNVHNNK